MAPIILIGFNRPHLIEKQLQILSSLKTKNLFISIDGPRNQRDSEKIEEIKLIIETYKDNFEDISVHFNEINLGCKMAIESALDRFFSMNRYGIIIEDDCIPNKSFLDFCSMCLKKYEGYENIGSITGSKFGNKPINQEVFLSSISFIWGWGTWSKTWIDYRKNYHNTFKKANLFSLDKFSFLIKRRFRNNALRALDNQVDTWDYPWIYYCLLKNKMCIVPNYNLIKNVGFGPDSTHTANYRPELSPETYNCRIKCNEDLVYDRHYDDYLISDILRFKFSLYDKLKKWIR